MIREQSQKVMSACDMLYGPGGQPGRDTDSNSETSETHTLHTGAQNKDGSKSPLRREVPICKGP